MRIHVLCLLVLGVSCSSSTTDEPVGAPCVAAPPAVTPQPPGNPTPVTPAPPSPNGVNATVEFVELEGGCWAIKVGNVRNQPTNLGSDFKHDGLAVRVVLKEVQGMASVCQIGPMVEIVSIQRR
jgi:hypothetical protein